MPIVAAVLHLDPLASTELLARLEADDRVDLGEAVANKLPIVVDTASRRDDKHFWKGLESEPAVLHRELVFAEFSDVTNPPPLEVAR